MKKENLLTTIAIGIALLPFYASAESLASTTPSVPVQQATEAQVFTACSQAAIEVRDNSIGSARTTYNLAMSEALNSRKDAEKNAVALDDEDERKDAIRAAVEDYKKAVTSAQDGLTKARKEAWSSFETNANKCRDVSKDTRKGAADKRSELRALQATEKTDGEEVKVETKSFRESLLEQLESLKNFFKKGTAVATTTD